LEPWLAAIVKHPELITTVASKSFVGSNGAEEIYLLKTADEWSPCRLFSYALYQELTNDASRKSWEPLKIDSYQSVTDDEFQPDISLSFSCDQSRVTWLFSFRSVFAFSRTGCLARLPEVRTHFTERM